MGPKDKLLLKKRESLSSVTCLEPQNPHPRHAPPPCHPEEIPSCPPPSPALASVWPACPSPPPASTAPPLHSCLHLEHDGSPDLARWRQACLTPVILADHSESITYISLSWSHLIRDAGGAEVALDVLVTGCLQCNMHGPGGLHEEQKIRRSRSKRSNSSKSSRSKNTGNPPHVLIQHDGVKLTFVTEKEGSMT